MKRRWFIRICFAASLAAGLWFGYVMWYGATVLKPDAYAAEWTGRMIGAFMEDHLGQWPRGWSDLKPYSTRRLGIQPFAFERLASRVDVDFTADPVRLCAQIAPDGHATFVVVRLHHGTKDWFADPNDIVAHCLGEPVLPSQVARPVTKQTSNPE